MFGIVIIISFTLAFNSLSFASSSFKRSASALTFAFTSSASSFLPCAINSPICFESLLRFALNSSASVWVALACSSSSITSSTSGSFLSWNLFLIFCFTISGFSLTNFKSNIFHNLHFNFSIHCHHTTFFYSFPVFYIIFPIINLRKHLFESHHWFFCPDQHHPCVLPQPAVMPGFPHRPAQCTTFRQQPL